MTTLLQLLEENIKDCFDKTGEWEPNARMEERAADWVLTQYGYPEEVLEDEVITECICEAAASRDVKDIETAFGLVRRNARRIARKLMEEKRDSLEKSYREMGRPEHDDQYGLKRDIWNHTISMLSKA